MKQYVLLGFVWMLGWQMSSAQQVAEETRLFVKIKNESAAMIPNLSQVKRDQFANYPALESFAEILEAYQITGIYPASRLKDENLRNTYRFHLESEAESKALISELETLPFIEYAELVPEYELDVLPNDYNFPGQYHLNVIQAQGAWDINTGDSAVVIAVVDNAILIGHQDLQANIWVNPGEIPGNGIDDEGNGFIDDVNGYDVADNDNDVNPPNFAFNHGTHVSGCAAAVTDNGTGVASIGFNCSLMPIKATRNTSNSTSLDNTFGGVEYAILSGADIVNMSFGGNGFSNTWQNLLNVGHKAGMLFVGTAGNNGINENRYPASYAHVINVGATNSDDRKANYSSFGSTVDVMAPGTSIRSTMPATSGSYGNQSGTSMAAPIVAGLLGLMKSVNPCLTPDELEIALKQSCDNINAVNGAYIGNIGAGRINATAALTLLSQQNAPVAAFNLEDTTTCDGAVGFSFQIDSSQLACVDSYVWVFTDGQSFTDTAYVRNPTIQLPITGTYTVSLIVSNVLGADTTSDQVSVTVGSAPQVDAGQDLSLCEGETFQLEGITDQPGSTVFWFPETGLSNPDTLNPLLTATGGINYSLTVVGPDGCAASDTFSLTTLPNPTVLVLPLNGATITAGDSVQLNALGANSYSWAPPTGLSNPNINNPKASPATTTTYTVTGMNTNGCEVDEPLLITVTGTIAIDPAAFEAVGEVFAPAPNPADTYVRFSAELLQPGELTIDILNLEGKSLAPIFKGEVPAGEFVHRWERMGDLASGIYWVRWTSQDIQVVQRLILR